ncbi:F0F1 ATP synthase subunit B [Patescibacteria group bacterium]|nr:F0F1 ATP synthase subunit B [Patescibacteria group bacterium]
MDELIKTFHIDWKLLIAQVINFAIVLGVLWYFALRPLRKVMDKRTDDITKSLDDAKKIEKRMQDTAIEREQIIIEAKKEAQIIAAQVAEDTEKLREDKLHQTREEINKMGAKAKEDLSSAKEQMVREVKKEISNIIISASEKVIDKNIDAADNQKLIDETLNQVKE